MMKMFKLITSAEVVMLRFGIFVPMLLSLLTCSFGFTMDRSGTDHVKSFAFISILFK